MKFPLFLILLYDRARAPKGYPMIKNQRQVQVEVDEFLCHNLKLTLIPLIKAADEIQENIKESVYISPFLNAELDRLTALRGVGAGLIISTSEAIKNYLKRISNESNVEDNSLESFGPLIGNCTWVKAVRASSNYVRHEMEWIEEVRRVGKDLNLLGENNVLVINPSEFHNRFLPKIKKKNMKENIELLNSSGIDCTEFLLGNVSRYFFFAEHLGLLNADLTLNRFSEFQKAIRNKS